MHIILYFCASEMKALVFVLSFTITLLSGFEAPALAQSGERIPVRPFSYVPYRDFPPCYDTIKFFGYKREIEIGLAMPEWHPVRNHTDNVVFEGTVIKTPNTTHINTHVSQVDMPIYHYTYDMSFNAIPDKHPDDRYGNLMAVFVKEKNDGAVKYDTSYQTYLHIEWETGLGSNVKGNPCRDANREGESCGFYSAGHQLGDTIWNWPSIGDWVHVEGLWIFDRGHPPADAEIHPMRLIAIRRHLPEKIEVPGKSEKVWATRLDLFASGDGSALYNNRPERPAFGHPVKMSEKNYRFEVKPIIPKPSGVSQLRYLEVTQKGNTYNTPLLMHSGQDKLSLNVRWEGMPDNLVLAKTIYMYWDEGNGKPENYGITTYNITLDEMHFVNRKEFFTRHEMRAFADVGGKWFFINDLFGNGKPLDKGMGKSYRKKWKLDLKFTLHVPDSTEFRIHANSWELDGVDHRMGRLFDPYLPCTKESKKAIRKLLNVASPLRMKGCVNDLMGEVHDFYTPELLLKENEILSFSKGEEYDDICFCNKDIQNGMMSLKYRIVKVGNE